MSKLTERERWLMRKAWMASRLYVDFDEWAAIDGARLDAEAPKPTRIDYYDIEEGASEENTDNF